jgi:hypothetical protein
MANGDVTAKLLRRDPRIAQIVPVKRRPGLKRVDGKEYRGVDWVVTLAPGYGLKESIEHPGLPVRACDTFRWVAEFRRPMITGILLAMRDVQSINPAA